MDTGTHTHHTHSHSFYSHYSTLMLFLFFSSMSVHTHKKRQNHSLMRTYFLFSCLSPACKCRHTHACKHTDTHTHFTSGICRHFLGNSGDWGAKDGTVLQQQMMDGRGDHLFVEQRQRFAVLTSPVSKRATQSTVIDAALCGNMSSV